MMATVLINFMCQLGWARGCTDIWSNITLDVSVKVFFSMRLTFKLIDLKERLYNDSGPHPMSSKS